MVRKSLKMELNPKQRSFCNSKVRYPAFVGSWGCGKTLCGIIKILQHAEQFSDNLCLIVRKKFTDLRDSTLKDFERYTGMRVMKGDKEVTLSNKSVIMFRHGEELSGLQNVNLGAFMIEQAEEFETPEQFDLLRGRLRREEDASRQGYIIANTAGHNWIWDRWKNRSLEGYHLTEADFSDNIHHLPKDTIADWKRLKVESPRKYNRYVLNSWEDYDLEGAFYAGLMSDALKDDRVDIKGLWDKNLQVYMACDLGVADTTAMVLFQLSKNNINFIDCFEDYGQGLDHYVRWLQDKPYVYAEDYLPHDALQRMQGATISTRFDLWQELRTNSSYIVIRHSIEDGIQGVRGLLGKCQFDVKCKPLVNALNHYKRRKVDTVSTEDRPVFQDKPLHDWSSNYCLVAGTMIATPQGDKAIEQIQVGDYVITPFGNSRVMNAGLSKYADKLIEITDSSGATIICTPEHKIFANNSLVTADALRYSDSLIGNNIKEKLIWNIRRKLSLTDSDTGFRMAITNGLGRQHCTRQFGSFIMGLCRKGMSFITKTWINLTTTYPILNCLQGKNIRFCTVSDNDGRVVKKTLNNFVRPEKKQVNGMAVRKVRSFIQLWELLRGEREVQYSNNVSSVGENIQHIIQQKANTVLPIVEQERIEQAKHATNKGFVLFVKSLFGRINTIRPKRVARIVRINLTDRLVPVYDLTVEHNHCYYANGLLVSNSDAFRYACVAYRYMIEVDGSVVGCPYPEPAYSGKGSFHYDYDPLNASRLSGSYDPLNARTL